MGRTRRIELCRQNKMDAASRQLLFMSFKGIGKSIRMVRAPTQNADAPAHHSDQFPAGYSLTRCSPAALVSASPAGINYAGALAQLRGLRGKITKEDCFKNENRLETAKQSTQGWVNDHENPWVNDCENPQKDDASIYEQLAFARKKPGHQRVNRRFCFQVLEFNSSCCLEGPFIRSRRFPGTNLP